MLNMNVKDAWLKVWRNNQYYNLYCRKLMNFHWKIIHRAVYSEIRIQKIKRSNDICKLRSIQPNNLRHLLYECSKVSGVWWTIENMLSDIIKETINSTLEDVIFGLYKDEERKLSFINNLFILENK